ncbi:hypothetical protein GV827_12245 [Sulfitobacter sp. JBTF-M27]|uniref:Uncharacterized protein n=1 Tax=Sulfitobacter sediminilitoris TaxID=2698830 RepID=A0A6P0CAB7_9RHOB|nr:hypothetical protein [Sulfitobacter sediminilitoris]NEK23171.1 hypothetical protein [Sulfitobacter sediminilitoris]
MPPLMYSHRRKSVLQHTVLELGLTLSITDENSDLSLAENEAMIWETAQILGIKIQIEQNDCDVHYFLKIGRPWGDSCAYLKNRKKRKCSGSALPDYRLRTQTELHRDGAVMVP